MAKKVREGTIGGNMGVIIFFGIAIAITLVLGLFIAIIFGAINLTFDTIVPELTNIGMVGESTNISQYAGFTLTPINSVVQNFTWIGGIMFFSGILILFGFATSFNITRQRWVMIFYFLFAILLIFMSIFVSNIYEDMYNDTGDLGDLIREQTMLSYLMLHAPLIYAVVVLISGMVLFAGTDTKQEI